MKTTYLLCSAGLVASMLLIVPASQGGYDLTISHSSTDPDLNTSASAVGLDSLFVWLKCAEQGAAVIEADIEGDIHVFAFNPRSGILNVGTATELQLAIGGCPRGESTGVVLGSITVWDTSSTGSHIYLDKADANDDLVIVSCDTTDYVYAYVPRAVGFATGGLDPDTTGSPYGCGTFPKMIVAEPSGSLPYWWSEDYAAPSSGKGTNGSVTLIQNLASDPGKLIVGGAFSAVDNLTVPNLARLTLTPDDGSLTPSWDLPTRWSQLSGLSSGEHYLTAAEGPGGVLLVGGDSFNQPLVVCPSSGSCWTDAPLMAGPQTRYIRGITHWSVNDKFLIVGEYWGYDAPSSSEYHGLAQYDPAAGPFYGWEPFGYPVTQEQFYLEPDGFSGGYANVVFEPALAERPLEGAVLVGGSFRYAFGTTSGAFSCRYCAWLDPSDGSFEEVSGLDGAPTTLAQAVDGGTVIYAAGAFGRVPDGEHEERPSVMKLEMGGSSPGAWEALLPGLPPHPGPMSSDPTGSAVIYKLIATKDYLYAIGDFDQVLTRRGGFQLIASGFARFSFTGGEWQVLGRDALSDVGRAGALSFPAVLVGGDFTVVRDDSPNPIASYHFAQANLTSATDTPSRRSPPIAGGMEFYQPGPNPAITGSQLVYALGAAGVVDLTIYDVSGKLVRRVVRGTMDAGPHVLVWDGSESSGARCAPGVYFARLTASGRSLTRKITLMR